jgi:Ca2+-binding RTX toxin-like protein
MRLLKALIMGMAIMMMSQAATADICTTVGSDIVCDNNTSQYTDYRIGKLVHDTKDAIVVCARISGTWTQVGIENYVDGTTFWMTVDGCQYSERIEVVRNTATTLDCDEASSSEVTGIPAAWFIEGYAIYGDEEDDTIFGSDHTKEYLYGEGEDDEIYGYGGDDFLYGGDDSDDLYGGDGVDHIWGGSGGDYIEGNECSDYLYGGDDGDLIWGGIGDDHMWGDDGNDRMWGEDGGDTMRGGVGNDLLYGGDGDDRLYGEVGANDLCDGEDDTDYCAPLGSCDFFNDCE